MLAPLLLGSFKGPRPYLHAFNSHQPGEQRSLTSEVLAFSHTPPYPPGPRFSKAAGVSLRRPTADTYQLVKAVTASLTQIYEPDYQLIKAGVMLLDLVPDATQQLELDLGGDTARDRAR